MAGQPMENALSERRESKGILAPFRLTSFLREPRLGRRVTARVELRLGRPVDVGSLRRARRPPLPIDTARLTAPFS